VAFADLLAKVDAATSDLLGDSGITYAPSGGSPVPISGIFDDLYELVDPRDPGVSMTAPAVGARLVDLPADPSADSEERQGARVAVGSTQYRIREAKPDGKGWVILILQEA
jgi:hypothetical protein